MQALMRDCIIMHEAQTKWKDGRGYWTEQRAERTHSRLPRGTGTPDAAGWAERALTITGLLSATN
jgi:hypothetical protein